MDSSMSELEYFSSISSSNKSTRLSSAKGILKRIKQSSKNSHHAVYLICKRLFRGLGASNPGLRQGCFTAVVGFLKLLPAEFDLDSLEEIIVSELSPVGNNSKLEEGEAYLGQSLAYGAMIVSGILCEKSEEEQTAVFQKLFEISKKRSYLHHSSFSFLTMLLKTSGKEFNPDGFISHMQDLSTYTFDKLDYLITLVELQVKSPTIKKILGTKRFFDISNANNISTLLKKNKSLKMFEHAFFNNFVRNIVQHPEFFKSFWNSFCDKHIKSEMNKADIKTGYDLVILHFSLIIFKECTKNKSAELVEIVFNDKFLNVILRQARKEKHLVKSVLEEFCNTLKTAEDELKLKLIRHILFDHGLLNFDHTTGSKTLLVLSNSLSFNAVSELASDYRSVLEFKKEIPQKDIESKYKSAIICLNFYSKIINSPVCCDQIDWRLSQLVYLLKLGFFKLPDSPFNREFNQCVQEAFLTSLGHRFPSLESFQLILEGIVSKLNVLFKDSHISPIIKFNPEMFEAWSTGNDLAKKMEKFIEKNPSHKEIVFVLKLIVQYMTILLLKEPNTAVLNIQDLKNIYKELTEKQNVDKTMWIRVLIDLFLNLLSKPNYHHRHIIRCTFKFLCPHLTEEAFLQIIEVLDPSFESGNKEIEDEMDEEEEEEGENEELEENESDNESTESSDDEEMDEELSTNEKLRLELQNALGALSETESVDIDDMDVEEGKKLDETLSNIFRANVKKKKGDHLSKYQNQLAHFRTRVMDLIEICTEVVLPLSFWIKALGPLVALLESSVGQTKLECLRSRIRCCLKKLNSSKTTCDEMAVSEIVPLLENLLEKVSKSGIFVDMKTELVMTLKFLLKASKPFREGLKPKVLEKNEVFQCVNNSFRSMFEGKTNFPPQLITGLTSIGWDGILAMIPAILKYLLDNSLKPHKKLMCFQILESFIKTPQFFDGHLDKYYKYYLPEINELFTKYIDNETNTICTSKVVNNKYHSHLWNLMIVIINKQNNSQAPNLILADTVQNIISSCISRIPPMKGECKNNFRKLCNILNVGNMETNGSNSIEKSACLESTVNPQKSLLKRKRKSDVISKRKKKIKTLK